MDTFPVINSVLSPKHLGLWVSRQYGFRNVTCHLIKSNMNDSYLISAEEGRFVLRVYSQKHRSLGQVSEEVEILLQLKEKNVEVAYPVNDNKGAYVLQVQAPEGLRNVVLFTFAAGDKVRYLTNEMSRSIGVLTGKFHDATANQKTTRLQYSPEVLAGWAYAQVVRYFADCKAELCFISACEVALKKAFHNPALAGESFIWISGMTT